jgi:hypothetical protein
MNENTNVDNVTEVEETGAVAAEQKQYSEEEVAKLLQAESDRRVTQALAKQKKEYEKKLSLSTLDEQQRKDAEAQMKIQELQEQLAAFQLEKNKSELKSVLGARGLDVRFADIINITDDLEESQQNIEALDKLFKIAVKAEVEKRLAGNAPKGNGGGTPATITKEMAQKMSVAELQQLKRQDPALYNSLFNK